MQKKTTYKLKMTSNERHIVTQTDFKEGLTGLDQQCNRIKKNNKIEKKGKPRFVFLKILPALKDSLTTEEITTKTNKNKYNQEF
ncbi:MAG: hypothetical protein ACOC90_07700 [Bacteroidota bacterium]